ncbi:MAG: TIGR03943 family protein [Candidatus Rokubacteria bacterium]|nr:TIGR03943 family protein [Candidatus Rokubacteria bacterium]
MTRAVTHRLRAALLLGFAAVIAKLFLAGELAKYMSPALDPLTALTGLVLLVMGVIEFWTARRDTGAVPDDDEEHGAHGVEAGLTYALVLLPLVLGLVVTPRALGSGALGGERVENLLLTFAASARGAGAAAAPPGSGELADIDEVLAYLERVGEAGAGRRVRVAGMAIPGAGLGPQQFGLLRYSLAHCVADARPVALLVTGVDAPVRGDQWVEVEGTLATRERDGARLVSITADRVTPIEEPRNPYLRGAF